MQVTVYRLNFKAPLHIGLEGVGAEKIDYTVHSDTLWGALANAYLALGLDFDFERPPFLLSSAFPFFKDRLFFPVPIGALRYLQNTVDDALRKRLKKMQYVDLALFEALINGQKPGFKNLYSYEKNKTYLLAQACDDLEENSVFEVFETPRVTVDRYSNTAIKGQIFYFAQMVFAEQGGLFFLTHFNDPTARPHFEAALRLLGDEGLGADRTVGKGLFQFESNPLDLNVPEQGKQFITLSLYHPRSDEILAGIMQQARYGLVTRKGFAFHPTLRGKRRQFVRMFGEGSVFSQISTATGTYGDIPTVLSEQVDDGGFALKRYGLAFAIPATID